MNKPCLLAGLILFWMSKDLRPFTYHIPPSSSEPPHYFVNLHKKSSSPTWGIYVLIQGTVPPGCGFRALNARAVFPGCGFLPLVAGMVSTGRGFRPLNVGTFFPPPGRPLFQFFTFSLRTFMFFVFRNTRSDDIIYYNSTITHPYLVHPLSKAKSENLNV